MTWILAGFGVSYLLFFIEPTFLSQNRMQSFQIVSIARESGIDLKHKLEWSEYSLHPWLPVPSRDDVARHTVFPPFVNLFFAPLLAVKFQTAYRFVTLLSVVAYVFMTLWMPGMLRNKRKLSVLPVFFCITGLTSYGLQFELERGQWNVLAGLLVLLAIWIFHWHPKHRLISYVLFIIAVQLKLYPIIFILLLISDWGEWRKNVMRVTGLVIANLLLFFLQGLQMFWIWVSGIRYYENHPFIWEGNPSIKSALTITSRLAAQRGWTWLQANLEFTELIVTLLVVLCLLLIVIHVCRRGRGGPSPYYLLAAAIGCLLIPSGGHDYRLTLLGAPMALVLMEESAQEIDSANRSGSLLRQLAILLLSILYSTTLFTSQQKPLLLHNNFIPLILMLLIVTCLTVTAPSTVLVSSIIPESSKGI